MPDISKCMGDNCPLKEKCYRYTSPSSEYAQAYYVGTPFNEETQTCDYFWDINKRKYEL